MVIDDQIVVSNLPTFILNDIVVVVLRSRFPVSILHVGYQVVF